MINRFLNIQTHLLIEMTIGAASPLSQVCRMRHPLVSNILSPLPSRRQVWKALYAYVPKKCFIKFIPWLIKKSKA